jgi:hypothetical protein
VTSASRSRPPQPADRPRMARRPRPGGRPIPQRFRLVSSRRRPIRRSWRMRPRPPTGLGPARVHPDDGGATRRFASVPARQAMWCWSPHPGLASRTPLGPRHRCRGPRGAPFARCEGACAGKADIGAQPTDCAARRCCRSAHAASVARAANDVVHPVRTFSRRCGPTRRPRLGRSGAVARLLDFLGSRPLPVGSGRGRARLLPG